MNKEPIGLYIFRYVLGFGLFAFMCMLYWSSVLIENQVHTIRAEMTGLRNEMYEMRGDLMRAVLNDQGRRRESSPNLVPKPQEGGELSDQYPNILSEDPFYAVTLPKLLGPNFRPDGVWHDSVVGKPDSLHPFTNWAQVSSWRSQCDVTLAQMEFGKYETMAPNMALRIEERPRSGTEVSEYWVFLRPGVYWQPLDESMFSESVQLAPHFKRKHQVTAHDFKFYLDALMNPYNQEPGAVSLRNYLGDIEQIEVIDDLTMVVRWRTTPVEQSDGKLKEKVKYVAKQLTGSLRPLARFVYQYFPDGSKIIEDDSHPDAYRMNSVWAQNFAEHWAKNIIVSCGGWIFEKMTDEQIRFRRNPDHYFPNDVLMERMEVSFKNNPDSIWQDFKSNKIPTYNLRPDQLIELDEFLESESYGTQEEEGQGVDRLDYLGRSYAYIGWNQAKPYFKSTKVRQALTMAIDRERIIQQILNGLGVEITGPFFVNSPSYDRSISPWPFDPQAAKRLLEQEGWYDSNGDGVIDKMIDGKRIPFSFSLTYYVKNQTSKAICEYVSTALKQIGVDCRLNGVDIADLSGVFDDKSFDALFLAWALGTPPEEPRQLWHSFGAKEKGSSNAVGFANEEADKIIEKLQYESDQEKRRELYHRFHAIIHEEQPYTFLYTPKSLLLYRKIVQNVFIPAERQDLIPGANVAEPSSSIFWLKNEKKSL